MTGGWLLLAQIEGEVVVPVTEDRLLLALLIGGSVGLILGAFVARTSMQRQRVHGGVLAQLFHYLGAAAFTAVPFTGLTTLFLGQGLVRAFLLAFSFVIASFVLLLIYAVFERPAVAALPTDDEGWTAEKARTSGL